MAAQEVDILVSHLFRQEAGRMAAVLTRMLGFENFEQAEDIVQDTLFKALSAWKIKGIPDNPSGWLHTVAKRKAIDLLRQRKLRAGIQSEIARAMQSEFTLAPAVNHMFLENEISDSQLRMIFACCHPAIPFESQLALTLKTLCGLSISEIARGFLTTEETIAKRLFRAREKIRSEKIAMEVPGPPALPSRMSAVLHSLYLLFNEGYKASGGNQLIRADLAEEAIRLCLLLTRNSVTNTGEANALLALMCFQASREDARMEGDGQIVLLQDQDRLRWNRKLIDKGLFYLDTATAKEETGAYQLEAAIAACHATAPSFEETDWKKICFLYDALAQIKPGPIVDMNRAIAVGFAESAVAGLAALLRIKGLDDLYLYHAALGDFYQRVGKHQQAATSYRRSIALTQSSQERSLLEKKLSMLDKDK